MDAVGLRKEGLVKMLTYAREKQNMSKRKLSRIIGTSDTVINLMEKGEYNPTLAFLDRYARGLGVRIDFNVWIRQKK